MILSKVLPVLAAVGIGMATFVVGKGAETPPLALPLVDPARPPFEHFVAGAGIVEPSSESIAIASPINAVVDEVLVDVGQQVKAGDLLLRLDDRTARAMVELKKASLHVAQAELNDLRNQLAIWQRIGDKRAVSLDDISRKQFAVKTGEARLGLANVDLSAATTELERHQIRAPIDGVVLQVKVRRGEFAPAQSLGNPLMIVGRLDPLHVRVDIDENDAWRVVAGEIGKGYLRGNPEKSVDLKFVKFEPYVIPKRSLTGESSERVDTRVLQVVYAVDSGNLGAQGPQQNLYVGQLLDIFIKGKALPKVKQGESTQPLESGVQ